MNCSMPGLVAYALFFTLLFTALATSTAGLTMRADLTHVDKGRGFTRWELVSRMAARSRARAASLYHRGGHYGDPVTATVVRMPAEYLIHLNIGTPRPQRVALTMDTGSDLVWTQCTPCHVCFDQPSPMFDGSMSSTFKAVACPDPICRPSSGVSVSACAMENFQCFYLCSYGDRSITAGHIFKDTFTFMSPNGVPVAVSELAFGCGDYNTGLFVSNESGIAGFGRGPQSLPSQLKVGRFSYCLTPVTESKSSVVILGTPPDPDGLRAHTTGPFQSTPIIYNPLIPTFYYLSLEGITVGKTRLPFDKSVFALKKDGSGGTVIDSGTSLTTLPEAVFELLQEELVAQFPLPRYDNTPEVGDRLCFRRPKGGKQVPVPKLILHLAGADMDLPRDNYFVEEPDSGVMCLQINGAEDTTMVLIGNFQQQNMHVVYDVENNKLLFAPAQCDKL